MNYFWNTTIYRNKLLSKLKNETVKYIINNIYGIYIYIYIYTNVIIYLMINDIFYVNI